MLLQKITLKMKRSNNIKKKNKRKKYFKKGSTLEIVIDIF